MEYLTAKAVLSRNYLFRELPDNIIEKLASLAVRRIYDKGAIIFAQGDEGDALYGVASGRVRIGTTAAEGKEMFLNIMEPGDTFGEIAVVDGLPRTAGATALDTTTVVIVRRADFLNFLKREPLIAIHLLRLICERLRWISELVEESVFLTGPARLARRLSILASLHGHKWTDSIELKISQADLAQFLGISRQIVNQHLQEWRRKGWIELARSRIIITDIDALRRAGDQGD